MAADPLAALREKFLARCREDLAALAGAAPGDLVAEPLSGVIHRLAGSAGSFGETALGQLAARLDAMRKSGTAASPADLDALREALAQAAGARSSE